MNDRLIKIIEMILNADLPTSTKNEIVKHYFLPRPGDVLAPIQLGEGPESVDRPSQEEIEIEENPKLKAEYKDTEKLMRKVDEK